MKNSYVRDNKDILEMFEAQYTRSEDKYSAVKRNWREDNDFSLGKQWDDSTRNDRSVVGSERPCITVNKIDPLVHRIVNEAKQEKLEAKVKPGNDAADPDAADVLSGLLRKIQYTSGAIRSYMWAYECAIRAGVGYFKVINEFENDESFDQTVAVKRIVNPMTVSFDPDSEDPAGRDAEFAIISTEISKMMAENMCKDVDYDPKDLIGMSTNVWDCADGTVRHGEIQWMEREADEIIELVDGSTLYKSDLDPEAYKLLKKESKLIKRSRSVQRKKVKYASICDGKVIEKLDINSKYITIVRMIGREGYIDGKLDYRGITRNSMDSNRMYNVMSSLLVERVGLAPRAPYIGAAGQFEGYTEQWLKANRVNLPYLEYNPVSLNGSPIPPPQKNDAVQGDPTIERYMMISSNDIKDSSAMSDAFMGNTSNEVSGKAITARAGQSSMSTFDFSDNCHNSIEHGATIILDMLPKVLGARRVVQILGEDMAQKTINLDMFEAGNGKIKNIDLSGKYSLEVTVSSGDKSRRELAIEQLSFVMQTNPEASNLVMDVFVSNLDIKDAKKIANRFKALLPPKVISAEEDQEKDNPELDAFEEHALQLMEQVKGQLEACQAELAKVQKELEDKKGELHIKQQEVDVKKRLAEVEEYVTLHPPEKEGVSKDGKTTKETKKSDNKDDSDDSQILFLIQEQRKLQEELDMIHAQLDMITKILSQNAAPEGPAQSPEAQTMGNGLPPAEAENNVGVANG